MVVLVLAENSLKLPKIWPIFFVKFCKKDTNTNDVRFWFHTCQLWDNFRSMRPWGSAVKTNTHHPHIAAYQTFVRYSTGADVMGRRKRTHDVCILLVGVWETIQKSYTNQCLFRQGDGGGGCNKRLRDTSDHKAYGRYMYLSHQSLCRARARRIPTWRRSKSNVESVRWACGFEWALTHQICTPIMCWVLTMDKYGPRLEPRQGKQLKSGWASKSKGTCMLPSR